MCDGLQQAINTIAWPQNTFYFSSKITDFKLDSASLFLYEKKNKAKIEHNCKQCLKQIIGKKEEEKKKKEKTHKKKNDEGFCPRHDSR